MARKLRIEYAGAVHHVMSRGDHREPVSKDDPDREALGDLLGQCCLRTGWLVHALCRMANHFHLAVETPEPNLAVEMKWLPGTDTGRFNRRHRLFGHVFSRRTRRCW